MILNIDGTVSIDIDGSNFRKFDQKESFMQEHLYRHFKILGHTGFLSDVSATLIDETDGWDPKKREDYWMKT